MYRSIITTIFFHTARVTSEKNEKFAIADDFIYIANGLVVHIETLLITYFATSMCANHIHFAT